MRFRRAPLLLLLTLAACAAPPVSLIVEDREREHVDISGSRRESLTPPFPSTRRIEVDVPEAGFLRFAPALVTSQTVRRARVSFRIDVESRGETTAVYEEVFRFQDANRWHDREIDLTRWAGQRVELVLATGTPEDRTNILWAERVRAIWGAPVVVSSYGRQLAMLSSDIVGETEEWILDQVEPSGVAPDDISQLLLSLALAGLLGLVIKKVYVRFALLGSNRDAYGNLFPLFSLVTVLVIVVVQSSLALSLGLLGALSIVRFRTAIKTPEEIAYLLFCISVGVALGAQQHMMAIVSVVLVSLFTMIRSGKKSHRGQFLLTITGDGALSALEQLRPMVHEIEVERFEETGDRVELKAFVMVDGGEGATRLISTLREKLPTFQFSFVAADDVV